MPCVVALFPGLVLGSLRVFSCALDPLLAKPDQLHFIPFLGQNRMALGLMLRGSLRLVVPGECFSSISNAHFFFRIRSESAFRAPPFPLTKLLTRPLAHASIDTPGRDPLDR